MGAKFAEMTVDEMRDLASDSLPKPPRLVLAAPLPDATIAEQLKFSDTALRRLGLHLENLNKEEAEIRAHERDYSKEGFQKALDALADKFQPRFAEVVKTIFDAEQVATEQGAVHNRHARRARAVFHRDAQQHAAICAGARLRFSGMRSQRLVEACSQAAADNDLATVALLHEIIEARDDGPLALSRSQRAEAVGYLDRVSFGEDAVAVTLLRLRVNAARARLNLGLIAPREVSRARIALGLMEQELAAKEKQSKAAAR